MNTEVLRKAIETYGEKNKRLCCLKNCRKKFASRHNCDRHI